MAATKSDLGDHDGNTRNSGRTFRPPTAPVHLRPSNTTLLQNQSR